MATYKITLTVNADDEDQVEAFADYIADPGTDHQVTVLAMEYS